MVIVSAAFAMNVPTSAKVNVSASIVPRGSVQLGRDHRSMM
ncbi:MAG: hypothetical protein N2645_23555 [Clostridia bacterium]|nr:hypothetical protein [Clostridia bacterium]